MSVSTCSSSIAFWRLILFIDGADVNGIQDFNPLWIAEFRKTNAFEVWNRITDPMLFDIVEARYILESLLVCTSPLSNASRKFQTSMCEQAQRSVRYWATTAGRHSGPPAGRAIGAYAGSSLSNVRSGVNKLFEGCWRRPGTVGSTFRKLFVPWK